MIILFFSHFPGKNIYIHRFLDFDYLSFVKGSVLRVLLSTDDTK